MSDYIEMKAWLRKSDGWVVWHGGKQPSIRESVEFLCRDTTREIGKPPFFYWYHAGNNSDIVAYRVLEDS